MLLAEVTNSFDWWATTGGVLGAIVFVSAVVILIFANRYWQLRQPHLAALQLLEQQRIQLDLEKDRKTLDVLDKLTVVAQDDCTHKERTIAILDRIDKRQESHFTACDRSHQMLEAIHDRLAAS